MALPMREPRSLTVDVEVDDVTIVLGLLSLLLLEHDEDDPLFGIATRVSERLRFDLSAVSFPSPSD